MAGHTVIRTDEDVRRVFDGIQAHMRATNATDLHRSVMNASFDGPERVFVAHQSSWVVAGRHLTDPYSCRFLALCEDGIWKIKSGTYSTPSPLLQKAFAAGHAIERTADRAQD